MIFQLYLQNCTFLLVLSTLTLGINFHEKLMVEAWKKFPAPGAAHVKGKKFKVIKPARRRRREEKTLKSHLIMLESSKNVQKVPRYLFRGKA